jgi:hypothetical protein
METVCFSETFASTDESTRRLKPEHRQVYSWQKDSMENYLSYRYVCRWMGLLHLC